MPRARSFLRYLTVLEEGLKEFVCVRIGTTSIFRDSHIVAFLKKVMGGQGRVSVCALARPAISGLPTDRMIGLIFQSDRIVTLIS